MPNQWRQIAEQTADDQFGLYAVTARFPHNLSGQVPWQQWQAGVYDCRWGTDEERVIVAGELPREAHNAQQIEQIRRYLDHLTAGQPTKPHKRRRSNN